MERRPRRRRRPNILVTGTPGTGKTTLCEALAPMLSLEHVAVGALVKEHRLYSEWDDAQDVPIIDDEKLEDFLGELYENEAGGLLMDFHAPEGLPAEWFDLIVVLRGDTATIWDRLEARGYAADKIRENVQAEIFGVVSEAVRADFADVETVEHVNDSLEQLEDIKRQVARFASDWQH